MNVTVSVELTRGQIFEIERCLLNAVSQAHVHGYESIEKISLMSLHVFREAIQPYESWISPPVENEL